MGVLMVPAPDKELWPTLGPQVCDLLEERTVHGPGALRGRPYVLDPEKRALIYRWYEVYPQGHPRAGKRRFKRAGLSVRKGTAKTELAAAVAFAELHPDGPVRCDGFDADGEPVGVPVSDPYIPMVAYTEEQTEELAYAALYVMVTEGPDGDLFDPGLDRIMRWGGSGRAVPLASSPDARDGARTTFQHFDETHRFTLPRHREAHQTMLANIPKIMMLDPWSLETTTTYTPGEGSVAQGTHEFAELIAAGKSKDRTLFFFHREAAPRPDEDLSDDEQIRAAVREASGPSIAAWPDFEGQVDAIVSLYNAPDTDRAYWERVWLNRRVQAGRQAFSVERWTELARPDQPLPGKGERITIGFDGAQFRDATALIATHLATGFQWSLGIWECPPGDEDWECPEDEVDAALVEAFDTWDVVRVYLDPVLGGTDQPVEGPVGRPADHGVVDEPAEGHGLQPAGVPGRDAVRGAHALRRRGLCPARRQRPQEGPEDARRKGPAAVGDREGTAPVAAVDGRRDGRLSVVGSTPRRHQGRHEQAEEEFPDDRSQVKVR